jgi:hypothetical protein
MTPIFRDDCLALMGITVWKERSLLSSVLSKNAHFLTLELLHDIEQASYLVLLGQKGVSQKLNAADKTVLKNILKAISWPLKECAWSEWVTQEMEVISLEEQLQMLNIQKVLVFGDCPSIDFHRPTLRIPSIQEILSSPQAKRKAWELLK